MRKSNIIHFKAPGTMRKNIYENLYDQEQKRFDLSSNPRIKIMLAMVNGLDLKSRRILDIGCYDGTFLSLIKNKSNKLYGIEASDYGFQEARRRGTIVEKFFIDDGVKFPYTDNFFDFVIAGEIIEHIYDTDFFLCEIKRILKKGGLILISTPNIASLGRRLLLLFGFNPIIEVSPNEPDSPGHIRYFTFKSLKGLLEKHNFRVIKGKSDVVNFCSNGRLKSTLIPKLLPSLGQSIIYLCEAR